jgi:DMSO/TMAO reductase YedYZ molybdopterin-dependent catalytic subunit
LKTAVEHSHAEPDWVYHHPHEPNLAIPGGDGAFRVHLPDGAERVFAVADLWQMPATTVDNCFIVSTGHGASGPFRFTGVALRDFLHRVLPRHLAWRHVDVVSADGFGARLFGGDLAAPPGGGPPLLAYAVDGAPLTREQGLVRLIVPAEVDDALRQVKWVSGIRIAAAGGSA